MKIGFLHSVKLHLGDIANAKTYRIMYEDWKGDIEYWFSCYYGEYTDRWELRKLIYDGRKYVYEFQDFGDYDLIALSLNFDTYPDDFRKFVTAVINDLYKKFPILYQKEVIILAGNEVFEKRGSAEKVVQTTWDTAMGILNSVNPNIEVCSWNEKIRTSEEKEAFEEVLNNQQHKSVCKYMGYQSLGTEPEIARQFIRLAQLEGYEVIDVELMTTTDRFSEIKTKFENNQLLGVDKVFIGCPYITKQLADYDDMFGKYALQVDDIKKDKQKIIQFVQEFKDKKEVLTKMFDDIVLGVCYKVGTRGWGVKRTQKIFNMFIEKCQENPEKWVQDVEILVPDKILEDGLFGSKTKKAIEFYQMMMQVAGGIDGKAGTKTLTSMYNFMLKRYDKL